MTCVRSRRIAQRSDRAHTSDKMRIDVNLNGSINCLLRSHTCLPVHVHFGGGKWSSSTTSVFHVSGHRRRIAQKTANFQVDFLRNTTCTDGSGDYARRLQSFPLLLGIKCWMHGWFSICIVIYTYETCIRVGSLTHRHTQNRPVIVCLRQATKNERKKFKIMKSKRFYVSIGRRRRPAMHLLICPICVFVDLCRTPQIEILHVSCSLVIKCAFVHRFN